MSLEYSCRIRSSDDGAPTSLARQVRTVLSHSIFEFKKKFLRLKFDTVRVTEIAVINGGSNRRDGDHVTNLGDIDPSITKPFFDDCQELKDADELVKKVFSLETADHNQVMYQLMRQSIKKFQRHKYDISSLDVKGGPVGSVMAKEGSGWEGNWLVLGAGTGGSGVGVTCGCTGMFALGEDAAGLEGVKGPNQNLAGHIHQLEDSVPTQHLQCLDILHRVESMALLTLKIRAIQQLLASVSHEIVIWKRIMIEMLGKRNKYLNLIRRSDRERFNYLVKELGITYKAPTSVEHSPLQNTRKRAIKALILEHCEGIKQRKLDAYKAKLENQKADFLREKEETEQWIAQEEQILREYEERILKEDWMKALVQQLPCDGSKFISNRRPEEAEFFEVAKCLDIQTNWTVGAEIGNFNIGSHPYGNDEDGRRL
ncbi:MRPS15 [Cordylochernes scorpioides]|uniref:Small ribosomal subunit protein uS15m n=1 Tax=Cordylochernes scorpioides TaxID=51811 RepID=A0ABY6L7E5_9ARAC|nr:MRPS15 [Cordylochernes scorpioides]